MNQTETTVLYQSTSHESMAPNIVTRTVLPVTTTQVAKPKEPLRIVWRNVALFALLHVGAIYGFWLFLFEAMWPTKLFAFVLYVASGLGITAGAHRLWCHRAYKAKFPLRLLLAFFNTIAFENDIYEWTRDHRVHHKYAETDADPHNANNGFFFAHMGWLMCRKHSDVIKKGKVIDLSDLLEDPIIRFQKRYYLLLILLCTFLFPSFFPKYFWGESALTAFYVAGIFRYCFTLHMTWLVNSAAHMWGNRPYDNHIQARENLGVSLGALGEGYHNYHHSFPWDYSTSELGWKLNFTTFFIDCMAAIGWAYDLKTTESGLIEKRKLRTGDNVM